MIDIEKELKELGYDVNLNNRGLKNGHPIVLSIYLDIKPFEHALIHNLTIEERHAVYYWIRGQPNEIEWEAIKRDIIGRYPL